MQRVDQSLLIVMRKKIKGLLSCDEKKKKNFEQFFMKRFRAKVSAKYFIKSLLSIMIGLFFLGYVFGSVSLP